jgi:hypothetical protein
LVAACGQTDGGDSTEAGPSATSSQGGQAEQSDADSSTEAMGIDTVEWPGNLRDAEALLDRMPDQLAGVPGKQWRANGTSAGVAYGATDERATAWVMSTNKAKTPESTLGVMFGPGVACEKDTFVGTVPELPYGGGPALEMDSSAAEGPRWYACTIEIGGAEGDAKRNAHAVGWVSGDLGWMTTTPDERTSAALIDALIAAR